MACPAKTHTENGCWRSPGWTCLHRRGKRRRSARAPGWTKQARPSTSSPQPQGTPAQDISSCQWLYRGAYVGNETRSIEFKKGGGYYMQKRFCRHVCKYGCAFLNSGGGILLVGVSDGGVVRGLPLSHEAEDDLRLRVDSAVKRFDPPLLPHSYSLHFLPVISPGKDGHHLKVLRLTFRPPPAFTEPTLFQVDGRDVYVRRDGSVQGPLGPSVILEWFRQMWIDKVQQLEQHMCKALSEKWFLVGQVHGLLQSINALHRIIASLLPSVGTPDARPARSTGARGLALESEHSRA